MSPKKPVGYVVSGGRVKQGRFYRTWDDAYREMNRQMGAGASQSGISEIFDEKTASQWTIKKKRRRR